MKPGHLSETEIQQYALGEAMSEARIVKHFEWCEDCTARAANYKLLFLSIEQQPHPVFDFDATELVLAQLPKSKESLSWNRFFIYSMVCLVGASTVVPLYLFRKLFINMADGISSFFLYAISAITIVIILYKMVELYRKYQRQMHALDFN
jgi:hypothetical protein